MSRIIFFISLIYSNYLIAQQNQIKNDAIISVTKMNIIYVGIDNPIEIAVPYTTKKAIKVSCDSGTLEGANGRYILRTTNSGTIKIRVYSLKNNDTIEHGIFSFRAKLLPDPIVTIGGYGGNEMSVPFLKVQLGITAYIGDLMVDINYKIVQYQVMIIKKDTVLTSELINGAYFSAQVKTWMQSLEVGDQFLVYKIKVKTSDEVERDLAPFWVTLR